MTVKLITRTKCPICNEEVTPVSIALLQKHPEEYDAELVITRTGYKQYFHSSCWYKMIREKRTF